MPEPVAKPETQGQPLRIAAVSYLNAKPLIQGLDEAGYDVTLAVPSALQELLLTRRVDVALLPVADLFASPGLAVLPVGGIGCDGPTLTVRLFSRVPVEQIARVHADTDSHTSVQLLRVVMRGLFGRPPELVPHDHRTTPLPPDAQAALLIGDKVVTDPPDADDFTHQLDLGEAWHRLTGLPFVFAAWATREELRTDPRLPGLARTLDRLRVQNLEQVEQLTEQHAPSHHWPASLALHYLRDVLVYSIGPRQREAIGRFHTRLSALDPAHELHPPRYADVVGSAEPDTPDPDSPTPPQREPTLH